MHRRLQVGSGWRLLQGDGSLEISQAAACSQVRLWDRDRKEPRSCLLVWTPRARAPCIMVEPLCTASHQLLAVSSQQEQRS